MPCYEYECPKCHERIELQRKVAELYDPVLCEKCPPAELVVMELRISLVAPQFPGASNWR